MSIRRKYPKLKYRTAELSMIMDLWIELQERTEPGDPNLDDLRVSVPRMLAGVPKCDDPGCRGWVFANGGEVQKCDACDRYPDDAAALRAARRSGWLED